MRSGSSGRLASISTTGSAGVKASGSTGPADGWASSARVHFLSRIDRPDALAVQTGFLGRRVVIPVEDVAEVSLGEERVVLRRAPRP